LPNERVTRSPSTNVGAAKELRLFRLGEHFVRQYQRLAEQFY
jgi:hypothetical protein